jgi:hypothetical protein
MTPHDLIIERFPNRFKGPRYIECGAGWNLLIVEFLERLDKIAGCEDVTIFSIKEKWGMLRIDINGPTSEEAFKAFNDLETEIEKRSATVCEQCGKPGIRRGGSWIKTACEAHK